MANKESSVSIRRLSLTLVLISLIAMLLLYYIISNDAVFFITKSIEDFLLAILPNFAAALVAAIVSILYLSRLNQENAKAERESLIIDLTSEISNSVAENSKIEREQLVTEITEIIPEVEKMHGIFRVHEIFPQEYYNGLIKEGRKIKIMTTWVPQTNEVTRSFQEALANGATIDILYLDPMSASCQQRRILIGREEDDTLSYYKIFLSEIKRICKDLPDAKTKIKVRLYDGMPSVRLYLCDEIAIVGFFMNKSHSTNIPNLEIHKQPQNTLFDIVVNDFDSRWKETWTREFNLETNKYIEGPLYKNIQAKLEENTPTQ